MTPSASSTPRPPRPLRHRHRPGRRLPHRVLHRPREVAEAANPGVDVTISFGSQRHPRAADRPGAPADLYASAGTKAPSTSCPPRPGQAHDDAGQNVLEIATHPQSQEGHRRLLADASTNVVLCAETVPCGSAADAVLTRGRGDGACRSPAGRRRGHLGQDHPGWKPTPDRVSLRRRRGPASRSRGRPEIPSAQNTTLAYPLVRLTDTAATKAFRRPPRQRGPGSRSWRRSLSPVEPSTPEPAPTPGPAAPDCSSRSRRSRPSHSSRSPGSRCWPRPTGATSVRTSPIRSSSPPSDSRDHADPRRSPRLAPRHWAWLLSRRDGRLWSWFRALVTVPWSSPGRRRRRPSSLPMADSVWSVSRSTPRPAFASPSPRMPWCWPSSSSRCRSSSSPSRVRSGARPPPVFGRRHAQGRPHPRLLRVALPMTLPGVMSGAALAGPGARRSSAPRSPSRALLPAARRPPHWPSTSRFQADPDAAIASVSSCSPCPSPSSGLLRGRWLS